MTREEAIQALKEKVNYYESDKRLKAAIETIFPELRESEDERIRKWIVDVISYHFDEEMKKSALAWLEKQKEHRNNSDAPNENSWSGIISSSDKDKNLDEIAQDYVDGVKKYNSEPTWDLIQTAVCYGHHLAEYKEQKPVEWSDEDEESLDSIIRRLDSLLDGADILEKTNIVGEIAFLKSLRQQPKVEWSEEDKKMIKSISNSICGNDWRTKEEKDKMCNWLNSLRPKPKVKLTELDENILEAAIAFVEQNNHFNCWRGVDKHTVLSALRSLEPHWKPSEEQMDALKEASVSWMNETMDNTRLLESLYNDLLKLKSDEK